jgi:two-component SAPR family response regulator
LHVPIVILSGHASARQVAKDLGASECLVKPVDLDELDRTISRLTHPG